VALPENFPIPGEANGAWPGKRAAELDDEWLLMRRRYSPQHRCNEKIFKKR